MIEADPILPPVEQLSDAELVRAREIAAELRELPEGSPQRGEYIRQLHQAVELNILPQEVVRQILDGSLE